jgi:hypothetical protein
MENLKSLLGMKVVSVRPLTNVELKMFGWEVSPCEPLEMIIFSNGKTLKGLIAMQDHEGNGPGVLQVVEMS